MFTRVWRDWAESWHIADVVMPAVSSELARRLGLVVFTAMAFVYAQYLAWHLSFAQPDVALLPWRGAIEGLALLIALLAGGLSCRQQLTLHPRSLLIPAANAAILLVVFVMAADILAVPAPRATTWTVALAVVLIVSVAMSLRLWAMLLFSLQGVRLLREGHAAARGAQIGAGGKLLVRLTSIADDGDARVTIRCDDGEREATFDSSLLPPALRGSMATGAWLVIDRAVIRWHDGVPKIVDGRVSYVGADPEQPAPSYLSGETLLAFAMLLAYQLVAIGLAYVLVVVRRSAGG